MKKNFAPFLQSLTVLTAAVAFLALDTTYAQASVDIAKLNKDYLPALQQDNKASVEHFSEHQGGAGADNVADLNNKGNDDSEQSVKQGGNHDDSQQNPEAIPAGNENQDVTPSEQEYQQLSLNVQVNLNMKGEFGELFSKEQGKFQIFLRAMDNPRDSTKGSAAVRLPVTGGQATLDVKAGEEPAALFVAISKVGNSYQHFCQGNNLKDGVMQGFPGQISISLESKELPYKTARGVLHNDDYPVCKVQ